MIKCREKAIGLGIVSLALTGSAILVIAGSMGNPETYGPLTCGTSACLLQTPVLDVGTAAYIAHHDNIFNGPTWYSPTQDTRVAGDKFVVCTSIACVSYTRTHSGGFLGGTAIPISQHGGAPNPSNPGGGTGGHDIGGGCIVCDDDDDERWGTIGDIEEIIDP